MKKETKIFIYGVDSIGNVVHKTFVFNHVSDEHLERVAKNMKAHYGATQVFAMAESKELKDMWTTYVKTRYSKNGLADFVRFEFLDYLKSGDWELAKA